MKTETDKNYRKIVRNFKARVKLMEKTPLKDLEKMFIEMYDYGIQDYIRTEKLMYPEKNTKEIVIEMYKLREKLKGRKK